MTTSRMLPPKLTFSPVRRLPSAAKVEAPGSLALRPSMDQPLSAGLAAWPHEVIEYGRAYTELEPFDGPAQYLANLRAARLTTCASPFLVHFLSKWAKYGKRWGLIECPAAS